MSMFLFDLDNTLLDTGRVVNEGFKPALQEFLDLDLETFERLNQEYWKQLVDSTDFDPLSYTDYLADYCSVEAPTLLEIMYQPTWFKEHVFPDVTETLSTLQKTNQLGLFTQGNSEYQTAKLKLAGLDHFFEPKNRFIFQRKLTSEALKSLPEATIIDDRISVIETASDFSHLSPVWLNRHSEKTALKVRQIQSLSDLLK